MTLEINTNRSKLRDVVEKIVKAKLGMSSPLIMQDSSLLYEVGDDLDEEEVAIYAANLEKVETLSICYIFLCVAFFLMMVCTSSLRCYLNFLLQSVEEPFLLLRIFNKSLSVALMSSTGLSCAFVICGLHQLDHMYVYFLISLISS